MQRPVGAATTAGERGSHTVLLVSACDPLVAALRARGGEPRIVVSATSGCADGGDFDAADFDEAGLAATLATEAATTVVFQCRDETDLPRVFFCCRAVAQARGTDAGGTDAGGTDAGGKDGSGADAPRPVALVILDLDQEEDVSGALGTLADGLAKAFSAVRVGLVSDRVPERLRRTHADLRTASRPGDVAATVAALAVDSTWTSGQRFPVAEPAARS